MVSVVKNNLVAQEFLELPEKPSREAGLVFQMVGVEPPLVLEEGFQVLCKGGWVGGLECAAIL